MTSVLFMKIPACSFNSFTYIPSNHSFFTSENISILSFCIRSIPKTGSPVFEDTVNGFVVEFLSFPNIRLIASSIPNEASFTVFSFFAFARGKVLNGNV